jgi:hypothetical protein
MRTPAGRLTEKALHDKFYCGGFQRMFFVIRYLLELSRNPEATMRQDQQKNYSKTPTQKDSAIITQPTTIAPCRLAS